MSGLTLIYRHIGIDLCTHDTIFAVGKGTTFQGRQHCCYCIKGSKIKGKYQHVGMIPVVDMIPALGKVSKNCETIKGEFKS